MNTSASTLELETTVAQLRRHLNGVFSVESSTVSKTKPEAIIFRGKLMTDSDRAFEAIRPRFESLGYTPTLGHSQGQDVVTAMPGLVVARPSNPWINLLLFLATVVSTVWTGGQDVNGFNAINGVLFAGTLLSILGVHELGHYFVARRYNAPVTLPYFIPLPFLSLTGTMGAVIRLKAPFVNRKSLFDVGIAGPLAGLVLAVPLMFIGLATSQVQPIQSPSIQEGNSLFYAFAKFVVFGKFLPGNGEDVFVSPVAWAAWWGLFITALNLLPAGQLDGGHVAFALLGRNARYLGWVVIAVMVILSFPLGPLYPGFAGWLTWAALIYITGVNHPIPLNDISDLGAARKALGLFSWVLFVLLFTPLPILFNP